MSIGGRIRFLLLLLGICCVVTALSLNNSITQKDLLLHEARELQQNLTVKEKIVEGFLSDPAQLEQLKSLAKEEKLAINFISAYRDNGINVLIYRDGLLQFWSSSKVFPPNINKLKEGRSFTQLANGYYEVVKKTQNNYTFIFLIIVKAQFVIENQYLKNGIVPELFPRNSLDLASFTDKDITEIFSIQKEYLFPVKLSEAYRTNIYSTVQLWLWIIALLSICLFVNSYATQIARKGYVGSATAILALFFLLFRITDLQFLWFNHQSNLEIFSPSVYAESEFLPSLGDLLLHIISITWLGIFMYVHKEEYRLPKWITFRKPYSIALHVFLLLVLAATAFLIDHVFYGLINNSKINFDITNIINLGWISWISILILCLAWFNLYLLTNIFAILTKQCDVTNKERLSIFLLMLTGYFIFKLLNEFNVFFIAYGLFIFIIAWKNYINKNKFSISIFALLFFCIAFLTSIKYTRFIDVKEKNNRHTIADKLLYSDDPKVINSISTFENGITSDTTLVNYFKNPIYTSTISFHNYIEKNYLDGYLSRFEYKMYEFDKNDEPLKNEATSPISKYKNLVRSGALKTSETKFSYRINDTFGYQDYFGLIPIFDGKNFLGTVIIELKSQPYDYNSHFPDLLIDGKLKSDENYADYSFAFYKDNELFRQSGKFTYPMVNDKKFVGVKDQVEFKSDDNSELNYSHAIIKQDKSKLIVISKEKTSFVVRLAILSFFFLVFILFAVSFYIIYWFAENIRNNNAGWFNINRYLMINANKILYKTRIQFSIVLSVVATLLIVGWTTFSYIKEEYYKQQKDAIRKEIRKVQLSYESLIGNSGIIKNDDDAVVEFNQFADVNASFLNLYDTKGNLLLTSLPKMYEYGIIGKKMGPLAFMNLSVMQKSEFLNTSEKAGNFTYAAAYAPIRNYQNQTIAYLGLPYYSNEADYQSKIGLFINTLINIYALVFVLIGVLAVFLAKQITSPLTFIQENIRRTKLGQMNKAIVWHRQDEIGLLVKEYNKMIAALEVSANKLARSERESAWREMAKQVAHEIKNPLTPLKLGVQLLEKSWKENDPNFEKKFASFNKSFLEQIDSLAKIASEFSNFAKMPDTKLEKLELLPIIEQTKSVFNNSENIEIVILDRTSRNIEILGDKDQLLRTFNNLLKNAIEASDSKKNAVIRIRLINDEKKVYVEVEDNGKGIEESLKKNIFVPNFTTKSSGTGLGLAFVKQATENAGGEIEFNSVENSGTTFYLTFPLL